jgi:phosphoglycolate phosphatase
LRTFTRVLTSNSSENVEVFLNQFGIRKHFEFISTCPKLRGKAKHLSAIARTYSLSPLNMIYIGDEVRDIKAAKRAAVSVAAVTWGFNTKEALSKHEPDWLISTPDELAKLIAS